MASLTLQSSFTAGELAPSMSARIDMAQYQQGCRTLHNMKVQPHGGAVKRPGFLLLDSLPGEACLRQFVFNTEQAYCLVFGENWLRVFTADGPVSDDEGNIYHIESPYTLDQARRMSQAQSADVLFLAAWGCPPRKLKRLDHNQWEFEEISFGAPIAPPASISASFVNEAKDSAGKITAAQLTTRYTYYVTAVNEAGQESELSKGSALDGPASNNWHAGDYVKLSWPTLAGATEYRLYKAMQGGRPGFVAACIANTYQDLNTAATMSEGAPKYNNPFLDGDYPALVDFFEQRLVFASTPKQPQGIWMSKTGDYANFATYNPITDDASLNLTIASKEVDSFCWIAALRSLILGTSSMEWEISATQGAFSAKSAKATVQSRTGSAKLPVIYIGNTLLHLARSGAQVRNLKYDFSADSYGGNDLSVMAAHLLEEYKITDWTYQQSPDSIVWCVRSDGLLLGFTFHEEHRIFAWHRHSTQGLFQAVCVVPQGHDDVLFAVIKRGETFFVERLATEYISGDYADSVFLDCALVYDQPDTPITTVWGLEHLEGLQVGILADGAVEAPRVVQNGSISLDGPRTKVIVGLEYVAELETMPLEFMGQNGHTVGRKKQISEALVLFRDSVVAKGGASFDKLQTFKWRTNEAYGEAPRPFSGIKSVMLPTMAENMATICLCSDEPVPMTILAIMAKMDVK